MTDYDNNGPFKISVLGRLVCVFGGFIFGIITAMILIGFRLMYVLTEEAAWLSWPKTILIALLIPGTFAIVAVCNAGRLIRFFRSKFWRRLLRVGLGVIGTIFVLIGAVILFTGFPELFFSLLFLPLGLCMLWTVFRGKDEDIANWWETF